MHAQHMILLDNPIFRIYLHTWNMHARTNELDNLIIIEVFIAKKVHTHTQEENEYFVWSWKWEWKIKSVFGVKTCRDSDINWQWKKSQVKDDYVKSHIQMNVNETTRFVARPFVRYTFLCSTSSLYPYHKRIWEHF